MVEVYIVSGTNESEGSKLCVVISRFCRNGMISREEGKVYIRKIGDVTVPRSDNDTITSLTRLRAVSKILSVLSFLFFCFRSNSILGTSKANCHAIALYLSRCGFTNK